MDGRMGGAKAKAAARNRLGVFFPVANAVRADARADDAFKFGSAGPQELYSVKLIFCEFVKSSAKWGCAWRWSGRLGHQTHQIDDFASFDDPGKQG
jgi:hypothetical protein